MDLQSTLIDRELNYNYYHLYNVYTVKERMNFADIKATNDILANIINFSDDGIISKTTEGIITSWNRGAQNIFGYTSQEVLGKHISILIPPGRLDEETMIIEKIQRREHIDHYQTERITKSGQIINISLTVLPINDSENNIVGVLKIVRDITLQKRIEEIQSRMADIVNFSDDAIITKTLDGIITSWNRGAEKIFGYTTQEVIGKHVSILIPPGRLDEEPRIVEMIKQGDYVDHYETERVTKSGSTVSISLTVSPIRDATNSIIGVLKISRDISIRKKAEEIQNRLAAIINFSDDAIISKTLTGTITSWNLGAQKIFGYSSEEIIGKNISTLIPSEKKDEEVYILNQISHGMAVEHYETKRLKKDGSIIDISITTSPIKDSANRIIGASKIARDISERKSKEEKIVQLNKELESFSYSISHDLKAPLRIINNYTEILQEDYYEILDERGRKVVETLIRNTQRMLQLIDDLLAFSNIGQKELMRSKIDANSVVSEIVDEIRSQQPNQKLNIYVSDLLPAYGDKNLIKQVWYNLLNNAVKYSRKKEKSVIEISSFKSNDAIVYSIKDNGVGFDMLYANKLFNVFQRLHHVNDFEGTGIGLAIVKRIIAKHGGKVWAEGKVNEGSTFYFLL